MTLDLQEAKERCKIHRKRVLEMSQQVQALHIGAAFSSMEMVDCTYHDLMDRERDTFVMSKGHGCMSQYVVLEHLGVLSKEQLNTYCTAEGVLGVHPDYGNPGIEASTGALGHGLSMCVGMALGEKIKKGSGEIYCMISDGELQEGSTWEAVLMASSFKANNLICMVDNNDFQSFGRTSETHPSFYPLGDKFRAFGWDVCEIDGHDTQAIYDSVKNRAGDKPLMIVARTTKGKGVSYMENVPIWHYRSPSPEEYVQAIKEIEEA